MRILPVLLLVLRVGFFYGTTLVNIARLLAGVRCAKHLSEMSHPTLSR